ncbi:MAG: guanylate kinase [Clostridia bacterium]|nr:guanylate kinase [Clostridia bacterium]
MNFQKGKGNLIIISGPSGVGKGTVCRALLEKYPDVSLSISATTRKPRVGEQNGREYFFYTREEFLNLREKNAFLEWAKVFDNYYGTPLKYVESILQQGQDCLLEIDVQGAMQVKSKWPTGVFIFIVPPSCEELVRRISNRGTESQAEIQKRLNRAEEEMAHLKSYDYVVVNDLLEDAMEKIRAIIVAERCRVSRVDWR